MSDLLELDNDDEVVEESTSTGETQATDQAPSRQPKAVNLDDLPEFRSWKSSADTRVNQAQYAANQATQQVAAMQQQMHNLTMQGMDDQQRLAYQLQVTQQQLADVQMQRQRDAQAMQRQMDMDEIHRETGIPLEELVNVPTAYDGWKLGNKYLKAQSGKRAAPVDDDETPQRRVDDRVDVGGGGKPLSTAQKLQREFDKALDSYNTHDQFVVMDKAMAAGVKLRDKKGAEV